MAAYMVQKGAQHIVLLSRSGTVSGQAAEEIEALRDAGANIVLRSCDVSSRASVDALLHHELAHLPPVRGIIHGAMVLDVCLPSLCPETRAVRLTSHRTFFSKK